MHGILAGDFGVVLRRQWRPWKHRRSVRSWQYSLLPPRRTDNERVTDRQTDRRAPVVTPECNDSCRADDQTSISQCSTSSPGLCLHAPGCLLPAAQIQGRRRGTAGAGRLRSGHLLTADQSACRSAGRRPPALARPPIRPVGIISIHGAASCCDVMTSNRRKIDERWAASRSSKDVWNTVSADGYVPTALLSLYMR